MGRLIYSNISAPYIHYPVIDFVLNIRELYEEGDLLIICFWDYDVYNFETQQSKLAGDNAKIREITGELSKLLSSLHINHKILYLSDGIRRINNHEDLFNLLLTSQNNVKIGDFSDIYKRNKYLLLRPTTIGKINFMIVDYLIALFFKELYPNLAKNRRISVYHTGERFLGVKGAIEKAVSANELVVNFPTIEYWKSLPIFNYLSGNWISTAMSKAEIEKILKDNISDKQAFKDLVSIGIKLKDPLLDHKINSFIKDIDKMDNLMIVKNVTDVLMHYLTFIKKLMDDSEEGEIKKITYIDSKEKFKKILESLNPSKLEILKYCNGKNTIEEIINLVSMKPSSVRSYLSNMKKEKLINSSKKPLRLIDELVISFE